MKDPPTSVVNDPQTGRVRVWAGRLFYNTSEPHDAHRRVTYTDPRKARPRVNGTGLFARRIPVERSARGQKTPRIRTQNTNRPMPQSGVPSHANAGRPPAPRRPTRFYFAKLTHRTAQLRLKVPQAPAAQSRASAGRSSGSPERHVHGEQQRVPPAGSGSSSRAPAAPSQAACPKERTGPRQPPGVLSDGLFWGVVQIRLDLAHRLIKGFLVFLFDKTHCRQSPRKTHLYPAGAATKHTFFYLNQQLRFYGFPVF